MSHSNLSEGLGLKQYIDIAKGLKNTTALTGLIGQVLSAPDVYVFGELLALPVIKDLAKDENGKLHLRLLEIFAYGKYCDYARTKELPLTEKQALKLKQLTLVALASENRVIPYSRLLRELELTNLAELGDLIIDALYKNLIVGKLDHEKQEFQVDSTIGRDVQDKDLTRMISVLSAWESQSESLLKDIEQKVAAAQQQREASELHKTEYEKKLEEIKAHIKTVMDMSAEGAMDPEYMAMGMGMGMGMDMMGMMGMGRRRGDKPKARGQGGRHMV